MTRQYGSARSRTGTTRKPADNQAVFLTALTWGRAVQAAAELRISLNELCETAVREQLKREAAGLFEREFRAEQIEAAAYRNPSPEREQFRMSWRPPSWGRETLQPGGAG